jgi:hypothetical protein
MQDEPMRDMTHDEIKHRAYLKATSGNILSKTPSSVGLERADEADSSPPITTVLSSTSMWLDELEASVHNLESKIDPILSGSFPRNDYDNESNGESTMYKIHTAVNRRLRNLTEELQQITQRVEL